MANGDLNYPGFEEMLRRMQLLKNMPQTQGSQDQSQMSPELQGDLNQMRQLQPPTPTRFEQAATNWQNVGPMPDPRAKDPTTKQDVYPRNKLLTALVAPLMMNEFLANPRKASENLSLLGRKGYMAAEEDYERRYGQASQDFKNQREIFDAQNKVFADNLNASKTRVDTEIAVSDHDMKLRGYPLEQRIREAQLAESIARAAKEKAPIIDKQPFVVPTRYGDVTAQMRTHPDGHFDFVKAGETEPIAKDDIIGDYKEAPPNRVLTNDEQTYNAKAQDWRNDPANVEWVQNHPKQLLPGEVADQISQDVKKDNQLYQAQQRIIDIQERAATDATRIRNNQQHQEYMQLRQDDIKRLDAEAKGFSSQLQALRVQQGALNLSDKNGAAAVTALIDQVMVGTAKMNSRYNSKEFDRYVNAAGGWENIKAQVQKWVAGGPGIPKPVLEALKKASEVTMKELQRQMDVNNKYRTIVEGTPDAEGLIGVIGKYSNELGDYDNWRKDIPDEPKIPAGATTDGAKAERDARKKKQGLQ